DTGVSVMEFVIEVRDRRHLADVIRRVRRLGMVSSVQRM
ncbi:MAG: ACT domain-containing protein, partial [Xanthomonadaceae bacterium]|nr:ACT domain-containing protein [Xanthomonadaceae bacterium]